MMATTIEKRIKELERLKAKGVLTEEEYQTRRAAIVVDTGPEKKQRGPVGMVFGLIGAIFKFGLLGVGALVGIVIVIIVIAVIATSGGGSSSASSDTHTAFAQGSSGSVETAGSVKTKVTIDKITDPATSTNQFEKPKAGNHYLSVAMTVENAGQKETSGGLLKLRTSDGFEYDQSFVSGLGSSLDLLKSLTSGGKTAGMAVFEVKDGSTVQWLKYDPNPLAKGDLYFDK